ncbi:MAG: hypothetical protein A3E82_03555 [Gammaproteobacteria bacterium RIFCSPHIGHO2_12_FULL_38_11]|nr:MAG: hypothetical protein A3E82_03555 [Gammaproteobacteria bacterium RIFCSPHIGHO2_12_FULL_38_11]
MAHNITTSVRLSPILRDQLETAAHTLHRGKNWIIVRALEAYLSQLHFDELAMEARRQSILASKEDNANEMASWEDDTDTTGWE